MPSVLWRTWAEVFCFFERDFLVGISYIGDEFTLLTETLKGIYALSQNPGAAKRRMHQKRSRDLYGKLNKHVENESTREQFATLGNDGRLAWELLERESAGLSWLMSKSWN